MVKPHQFFTSVTSGAYLQAYSKHLPIHIAEVDILKLHLSQLEQEISRIYIILHLQSWKDR